MDIAAWLRSLGLERYAEAFRDNEIDAEVLPRLTAEDLIALGVTAVGHRRKLLDAIAALRSGRSPASERPFEAEPEPGAASMAAPVAPGAERRQLTVLFCDLVGSTALSARLDPEEMRDVIRAYQNAVAGEITRFEGHVAKYMGDGVLAYFGWPRAHEDDAERAVRAGLAIIEAMGGLTPREGLALRVRIGIATGLVVVGELIGEGAAKEEAVIGETPNLAARLQALAEPDTVVIGPSTQRLVDGLFELADLGAHSLKGFAAPVRAWRVLGPSAAEGRFEARRAARLTPLVGREHELGLLLERFERAKEGEGQVVLLTGEPGIGKSRLVRALREHLAEEPYTPLSHYCSPYYVNSALYPVIDLLARAAGLERADPTEVKLEKLEALLAQSARNVREMAPLLAALLAIPAGDRYPPLALTPQQQRELTLRALVDQLAGLASMRPVLAVYEDVHWVDPSMLELLGLVVERVQALSVLALITFRPEFQPPWTGFAHVTSLSLNRLTRRHGTAMVDKVAGGKALPAAVLEQIVAKTDGVPLFVEELTKTVLESGLLREEAGRYELAGPLPPLAIPATLHDSLLARLDRLAPVKEVAQIGAAIGREFAHELLAAVAPLGDNELKNALDQLVQSELVFRRGLPPEVTYSFKHALVRDAAYQSLLKSRRQQLHARIAHVLEEQFPETAEAQPELLAHHFTQADITEKAVNYWYMAARQAMARSAMVEAAAQLTQALDLLSALPPSPDRDHKELDLQIALGASLVATKGWAVPEVGKTYARARELCTSEGQITQLLATLSGLFAHHLHWSSKLVALQIAEELLRLAEQTQDRSAQAVGHRSLAVSLLFNGQLLPAMTHFEQSLALYHSADRTSPVFLVGPDNRVACLLFIALTLLFQGYPDRALVRSREALANAYEVGHAFTTSQALYLTCLLHQIRGEPRVVHERSTKLIALTAEHHLPGWSVSGTIFHGWAKANDGATEEGITELRQGLAAKEAIGVLQHTPNDLGLLAALYIGIQNYDEALEVLDEALARVDRLEERWFEADLRRLKGEALVRLPPDRTAEAEACYHQALAVARDQGARLWELRAATSLARLWHDQGRRADAHDLLAPIYGWFTEGFDTPDLKDAKALLEELASTPASSVA